MTFQKGIIPWNKGLRGYGSFNKGKIRSEETKMRISQSLKGRTTWNKGKSMSEETKKKIQETRTRLGIYVVPKSAFKKGIKRSKEQIKQLLRRREKSSLEIKFEKIVNQLNLPYKFVGNGNFFIERKNPDFININGQKIAVEVFYKKHKEDLHGNIEQWKQEREQIFSKYGWQIIFFNETQVNEEYILKNLSQGRWLKL